jgi:hypothetical protein
LVGDVLRKDCPAFQPKLARAPRRSLIDPRCDAARQPADADQTAVDPRADDVDRAIALVLVGLPRAV